MEAIGVLGVEKEYKGLFFSKYLVIEIIANHS